MLEGSSWVWISALITVAWQAVFFAITVVAHTDKVTDFSGSTNFFALALLTLLLRPGRKHHAAAGPRLSVLCALVMVWAVRLGGHLLLRVMKRGKDDRFDAMRGHILRLAGFWVLQVVWVWTVSLPVILQGASRTHEAPIGAVDVVGWLLFAVGLAVEAVADWQKWTFTQTPADRRKQPFMDQGLWSLSRHPNYLGEMLLWLGLALTSSYGLWSVDRIASAVLVWLSPLLTILLLCFVSGIPIAEKRDDARFSSLESYAIYKKQTPLLIPKPF